jgi:hypothetical protein
MISSLLPPGHLALGEAFQQAFGALENVDTLRGGDDVDLFGYDEAIRRVERRMRNALADGELCPRVSDPATGLPVALADREKWRVMSFTGLGLDTYVQHLTNPGPNTNGLPVGLDNLEFQSWLNKELGKSELVEGASSRASAAWIKELRGMRRDVAEVMIELWGGFPSVRLVIAEREIAERLKAKNKEVPNDVGRMLRHIRRLAPADA